MVLAFLSVLAGLAILVWSADRFVDGSASTARYFGMPPLLIGMVIVGFGTSAPEMTVSALASLQGNGCIALGNAYGSNIANIALILGLAAIINPINVSSVVLRKELPILCAVTALAFIQLWNGYLSRLDAFVLLAVFAGLMGWTILNALRSRGEALAAETDENLKAHPMSLGMSLFWLVAGLVILILSSRLLVWGAVELAKGFGVSDLIIGLTIVAVGTSLPELASSVIAARKRQHDIALGNIIGSNLFNTLAVVGIAGVINPLAVPPEILSRDMPVMCGLTLSLFVIGYGFKGRQGSINRCEGTVLLSVFIIYNAYLVWGAVRA